MQRKQLMILFTLILMIIFLSNVLGITTYKPKYGITTARVNFRSCPILISSTIIHSVSNGSRVKLVGEYNNFYIVQLQTNEIGLIHKDYINPISQVTIGSTYTRYASYTSIVNANYTVVRRGPGKNFTKVTTLNKGTSVTVIGKINDYFAVIYKSDKVGMIHESLLGKTITSSNTTPSTTITPNTTNLSNADLIIKYINDERSKQGLKALVKDSRLMDIAQRKSNEMVEKNYFLHTSPTYGTPFTMMTNFGITYKTAGENIAGNPSLKAAIDSWMNSAGHRANILSTSYTNVRSRCYKKYSLWLYNICNVYTENNKKVTEITFVKSVIF